MMRILITGGRSWDDKDAIEDAILNATRDEMYDDVIVVHGGAKGADGIAADIARLYGMNVEEHPANWAEHHRAAGPIRNQKMVDLGADLCLAFLMPNSKGTADCIRRVKKAGIPLRISYYKSDEADKFASIREIPHFGAERYVKPEDKL